MAKLAILTSVLLHAPFGDPQVQGFVDRLETVFGAAATGHGVLDVASEDSAAASKWGAWVAPAHYRKDENDGRIAQTLSLWTDLEPLYAYAYNGLHAEAMSKRKQWIVHGDWASHVLWWVDDDHTPTWQEACDHYDYKHDHGVSPHAFDFRHPFNADGQPVQLDRELIKSLAAHYKH